MPVNENEIKMLSRDDSWLVLIIYCAKKTYPHDTTNVYVTNNIMYTKKIMRTFH